MLGDPYTKMMFELLELRRMVSQADRVGAVHEVKKDKIRVKMGIRPDGTPWLSPWLHTEDHRGFSSDNTGHTQRQVYTVGQTVKMSLQGNDHRAATVSPYSESNSQQPPAHADNYLDGKDQPTAETYQNGKLRIVSGHKGDDKKKFHDIWIDENDDKPQAQQAGQAQGGAGGGGAQQPAQQQQLTKEKPILKMRISEDGGFTARYKTDMRVAASADGAKVKAGTNFVSATKDKTIMKSTSGDVFVHAAGTIWMNKPPQIKDAPADPIKDDNK